MPETTVRIREVSRDGNSGRATLKLTPVNADRLYADIGGSATTASMKVEGANFDTAELRVSFLAEDSTGEHDIGEPVEWTNRITLKSREYMDGNERMFEIRSAPPADIRYSTDGSDPMLNGGSYEGVFAIPEGTRIILAVAEKKGIVSQVLRQEITEKPQPKPIDKSAPAVWRPRPNGFRFAETRTAYGFINRLKKHEGSAGNIRFAVEHKKSWADLSLSEDIELDGERMEQTVEQLRAFAPEGEVTVEAKHVRFSTGQRFLDYLAETKSPHDRDDVEP